MPNSSQFVKALHERNRFLIRSGYVDIVSERGTVVIILDRLNQIELLYNDKTSERLIEQQNEVQGLPIKHTNAPKFVFLNDQCKESGEQQAEEKEDEFADLYKAMEVHDLTGNELIYLKRLEQLGVLRKKFQI
mmetsp:Transcript_7043/g.11854  ORF Transcript_7043/g.11854 Transcript_7043/m.11854 type:complete len:133 (-) Transcript_7043:26-424(-)